MLDFRQRCTRLELMDDTTVMGNDVMMALSEIESVNRYLGGIRASLLALHQQVGRARNQAFTLLDLGTGAADVPVAIVRWARTRGHSIRITAVDVNASICDLARAKTTSYAEITVQKADVFHLPFAAESFDFVHSAMFLHHFPQAEAAHILRIMHASCRKAIMINDLYRHPVAYYSISVIARLLSRSPMFQHDAPLSVLRGFKPSDWEELGRLSGIENLVVERRWPFRFVVTSAK